MSIDRISSAMSTKSILPRSEKSRKLLSILILCRADATLLLGGQDQLRWKAPAALGRGVLALPDKL